MNTKVMHNLTCGLFMLSSKSGDKTGGCIINTVMQVTSKPLRITITVNKANHTHDLIAESGVFAVSLLSEEAPFGLFQHFGFQSSRDVDKFAGLSVGTDCNGVPYLTWASCGYLSCKVVFPGGRGGRGRAARRRPGELRLLSGQHQAQAGAQAGGQGLEMHHLRLYLRGRGTAGGFRLSPVQAWSGGL